MLNEEKVKSMTKAAAYEKGPKKKNIEIANYFRTDYIALQLIKSAVAYVVAFALLVVIWGMTGTEEFMLNITHAEYIQQFLKTLIILFILGLLLYEGAVFSYYSRKYRKASESVDEYQVYLKKINKFYETQESADEEIVEVNLADEEITV